MPRLLALRALAPLLAPLNALPPPPPPEDRLTDGDADGADREALGDGLGRLTLGDALGRLADGVPVEGRPPAPVDGRAAAVPAEGLAAAVPAEGRAPEFPVEGRAPAPPAPQPRASVLRAEVAALGEPLLLRRLWSGCHFFCPAVAPEPRFELTLVFRLKLLLTLTFTSLW